MSDASSPPPTAPARPSAQPMRPTVHGAPTAPLSPADRKRQIVGIAIGIAIGIVLLVATPLVCSAIDARMNPGELAGLGGFFLGAIVGGGLLLMTTVVTYALPTRRRNPLLRGASRGLASITVLAGVALAVFAVM